MTAENSARGELQPASILSYVRDLPNLCSLAGLACTILAIYFSILGVYSAAMISMIWVVAFDWGDGLIARRMKGRTGDDRTFGGQLDSLIDIVSFGVTPAILLMSYGNFEPIFLPGAFLIVAGSALRLSYFGTFGLAGGSKYTGMALDNNNIIMVFLFLFEGLFPNGGFAIVLYAICLGLTALNVSSLKTPKLSGKPLNVFILVAYTLVISAIYGWQLI